MSRSIIKDQNYNLKINQPYNWRGNFILLKICKTIYLLGGNDWNISDWFLYKTKDM